MIIAMDLPLVRRVVPLGLAAVLAIATLELIRRRKLREEYAMFWFFASMVLLIVALVPDIVIWLQGVLQTGYLTLIVLICFFMMLLITLHFAVVASRHTQEIHQLAQQIAMLKLKLREREEKDRETERPAVANPKPVHE